MGLLHRQLQSDVGIRSPEAPKGTFSGVEYVMGGGHLTASLSGQAANQSAEISPSNGPCEQAGLLPTRVSESTQLSSPSTVTQTDFPHHSSHVKKPGEDAATESSFENNLDERSQTLLIRNRHDAASVGRGAAVQQDALSSCRITRLQHHQQQHQGLLQHYQQQENQQERSEPEKPRRQRLRRSWGQRQPHNKLEGLPFHGHEITADARGGGRGGIAAYLCASKTINGSNGWDIKSPGSGSSTSSSSTSDVAVRFTSTPAGSLSHVCEKWETRAKEPPLERPPFAGLCQRERHPNGHQTMQTGLRQGDGELRLSRLDLHAGCKCQQADSRSVFDHQQPKKGGRRRWVSTGVPKLQCERQLVEKAPQSTSREDSSAFFTKDSKEISGSGVTDTGAATRQMVDADASGAIMWRWGCSSSKGGFYSDPEKPETGCSNPFKGTHNRTYKGVPASVSWPLECSRTTYMENSWDLLRDSDWGTEAPAFSYSQGLVDADDQHLETASRSSTDSCCCCSCSRCSSSGSSRRSRSSSPTEPVTLTDSEVEAPGDASGLQQGSEDSSSNGSIVNGNRSNFVSSRAESQGKLGKSYCFLDGAALSDLSSEERAETVVAAVKEAKDVRGYITGQICTLPREREFSRDKSSGGGRYSNGSRERHRSSSRGSQRSSRGSSSNRSGRRRRSVCSSNVSTETPTSEVSKRLRRGPHGPSGKEACLVEGSRGPQHAGVLIFDWDDTFFPNSWLAGRSLSLTSDNEEYADEAPFLRKLTKSGKRVLEAAVKIGSVVLVTNAAEGWIDETCKKFLPGLWATVQRLRRVSARFNFDAPNCESPFLWKRLAFKEELDRYLSEHKECRSVVSIGDGPHEREALFFLQAEYSSKCRFSCKSLKLTEAPSLERLYKQHSLLLHSLTELLGHEGDLDLCVRGPDECDSLSLLSGLDASLAVSRWLLPRSCIQEAGSSPEMWRGLVKSPNRSALSLLNVKWAACKRGQASLLRIDHHLAFVSEPYYNGQSQQP